MKNTRKILRTICIIIQKETCLFVKRVIDFHYAETERLRLQKKNFEPNNTEGKIMSEIKKVVLAYSGGLDTSIIIPWLKENYNDPEIIAVSGNVGQADELEGLEEKALKTGAAKLYIEDLTDEMVDVALLASAIGLLSGFIFENFSLRYVSTSLIALSAAEA